MSNLTEIWKPIKDYEDCYEVSNLGRVRSLPRNGTVLGHRILKTIPQKSGHLNVNLSKDNKMKRASVHRLVGTAFIPNPDSLPIVMHLDDDPANNVQGNLQWATWSQNTQDMHRKGRHPYSEEGKRRQSIARSGKKRPAWIGKKISEVLASKKNKYVSFEKS